MPPFTKVTEDAVYEYGYDSLSGLPEVRTKSQIVPALFGWTIMIVSIAIVLLAPDLAANIIGGMVK